MCAYTHCHHATHTHKTLMGMEGGGRRFARRHLGGRKSCNNSMALKKRPLWSVFYTVAGRKRNACGAAHCTHCRHYAPHSLPRAHTHATTTLRTYRTPHAAAWAGLHCLVPFTRCRATPLCPTSYRTLPCQALPTRAVLDRAHPAVYPRTLHAHHACLPLLHALRLFYVPPHTTSPYYTDGARAQHTAHTPPHSIVHAPLTLYAHTPGTFIYLPGLHYSFCTIR